MTQTAGEILRRWESAVVRSHRRCSEPSPADRLLDARWQLLLCGCSRTIGKAGERCDHCLGSLKHPVEVRLSSPAAFVYAKGGIG